MDKKETKRPEKHQNEGKDKSGKRKMIIFALFGGLGGALLVGLLTYFFYYQPQLENMQEQTEIMKEDLERNKIETELWVLRDANDRAQEELEKRECRGENVTELREIYDEAIKHAMNASDYKITGNFDDAWEEIGKSRVKFRKIVPIIKDVTFQESDGA